MPANRKYSDPKEGARRAAARHRKTEKYRRTLLKNVLHRKYGITLEEFEAKWAEQGGKCAICKESLTLEDKHVDHDHETGEFRGILCRGCNHGLGNFKDNVANLTAAIQYLEQAS